MDIFLFLQLFTAASYTVQQTCILDKFTLVNTENITLRFSPIQNQLCSICYCISLHMSLQFNHEFEYSHVAATVATMQFNTDTLQWIIFQ